MIYLDKQKIRIKPYGSRTQGNSSLKTSTSTTITKLDLMLYIEYIDQYFGYST